MQKSFDKKLLIVGIDPGTTLGYAVLDLGGNLLKTDSSKQLALSSLISEIIKLGKPIIAASDVAPAPDFVKAFASKTGCRLIEPKQDLLVQEKRQLTKDFRTQDIHQMDSLASALFAYNEVRQLLIKIDKILSKANRQDISRKVKEIVIKQGISIKDAVMSLEHPVVQLEKTAPTIPDAPTIPEQTLEQLKEKNQTLSEKLNSAERDIHLLKSQNFALKKELESASRRYKFVLKKIFSSSKKEKTDKAVELKQKTILSLSKELEKKKSELCNKAKDLAHLNSLISKMNENALLKKLNTLSYEEFMQKNSLLNIREKDILLINDLDISSEKTINLLKNKVCLILYRKASRKTLSMLPFTMIDANAIKIDESSLFAVADKSELESAKANAEMLKKIVEEYRQERL